VDEEKTCGTCEWYKEAKAVIGQTERMGNCLVGPPTPVAVGIGNGRIVSQSFYPAVTFANTACGQHEPQEEANS